MAPYGLAAPFYDILTEPFLLPLRRLTVSMLTAALPPQPGIRILEIGCGTGSQASWLARCGYTVYGLDSAWAMLHRAGRKRTRAHHGRLRIIHGDAADLPFRSGTFHAVVAQLTFHEMAGRLRKQCGMELKRIARPDALFLAVDFIPPRRCSWMYPIILAAELTAGWSHFRNGRIFTRQGGLPVFFEGIGLTVEKTDPLLDGNLCLVVARLDQSLVQHGPHHLHEPGDVGAV